MAKKWTDAHREKFMATAAEKRAVKKAAQEELQIAAVAGGKGLPAAKKTRRKRKAVGIPLDAIPAKPKAKAKVVKTVTKISGNSTEVAVELIRMALKLLGG